MPKEKVTVTLDAGRLAELRALVGGRSVSATLDAALASHLDRLRHLAAVDEWLAEMDREHGPVPVDALERAEAEFAEWDARRASGRDARRAG